VHEKSATSRSRHWRLNDLRLRNRLILLVLLPLVGSIALAAVRVVSEADAIQAEDALNSQVRIGLAISDLVHAVQDERDLITVYLTNGQLPVDMTALSRAEAATTNEITVFQTAERNAANGLSALAPATQQLSVTAQARLNDLPALRSSVQSLGDSRPIFQAYSTIVTSLLNFSQQLSTSSTDHMLGNLVSTLSFVQQAGEQTSEERGYLVGILGNGGQLLQQQEALVQAQAQYNSAYASFSAQAPAAISTLYNSTIGGDDTGAADSVVQQAIDAALEAHPVAGIGVTATAAFTEATTKLGQIRSVETHIGQSALSRTSSLLSSAKTQLYINLAVVLLILLLSFLGTAIIARSIVEPLRVLRSSAHQIAGVRLPEVIRRLRETNSDLATDKTSIEPIDVDSADEIGEVARAFDEVHHAAVRLASEQALLRNNVNAIFMNLSRRSQTLVERQLRLIDELENSERNPDQLSHLFKLDHLATRMRRNNENLLVLAGEETARRWTESVRLVDVARAAAAEVEQYERIMLGEVPRADIIGKAAPDVAHLIAELMENATTFSSPHTKVWVAARSAEDGGVVLRIEDVGIGMTTSELADTNDRISNPPVVDVSVARRMGLFVVGRLAARYGIRVRLNESQAGGITASVHIPVQLIAVTGTTPDRSDQRGIDDEFYALSRLLTQNPRRGMPSSPQQRELDAMPAAERMIEPPPPAPPSPPPLPRRNGTGPAPRREPTGEPFPAGSAADGISWFEPTNGQVREQPTGAEPRARRAPRPRDRGAAADLRRRRVRVVPPPRRTDAVRLDPALGGVERSAIP
jgi:signal transduction histidine kinase